MLLLGESLHDHLPAAFLVAMRSAQALPPSSSSPPPMDMSRTAVALASVSGASSSTLGSVKVVLDGLGAYTQQGCQEPIRANSACAELARYPRQLSKSKVAAQAEYVFSTALVSICRQGPSPTSSRCSLPSSQLLPLYTTVGASCSPEMLGHEHVPTRDRFTALLLRSSGAHSVGTPDNPHTPLASEAADAGGRPGQRTVTSYDAKSERKMITWVMRLNVQLGCSHVTKALTSGGTVVQSARLRPHLQLPR